VLSVAACGGASAPSAAPTSAPATTVASVTPAPQATVAATPDVAHPVGIIAIGHSALTGEGTAGPIEPNLDASWATGTMSSVDSIAARMIEAIPETAGHVANTASGGAPAALLKAQAKEALAKVPVPALVIIDTIDNDIQCNASTVKSVGQSIANALAFIHEASPNSKILVVDQPGRPSVDFVKHLVELHPEQKANLTWADACTFYDTSGNLNPGGFAKLTTAIDAYEAEQSRVCALVPNCSDDGGVRRAYVDMIENFSPDYAHFNVRGQAAQAALLWPVVEKILGL